MVFFSSGMENTHEQNFYELVKGYSISQHYQLLSLITFTVCNSSKIFAKPHGILTEIVKKLNRSVLQIGQSKITDQEPVLLLTDSYLGKKEFFQ